jgi:hypothetical protein
LREAPERHVVVNIKDGLLRHRLHGVFRVFA